MATDERLEFLKFVAETHRTLHEKRQHYEWRIVFTTLSFYVLCVAAAFSESASLPQDIIFACTIWALFIGLALLTSSFLWFVHKANARNKTYAERAEGSIVEILNDDKVTELRFPLHDYRMSKWAFGWQATTIHIVGAGSAFLITVA